VDDIAKEVFEHDDEVVDDFEGFPGGLHDPSMLIAYADHVAIIV